MRDDQVDELVRQLDVPAHPDPYFTDQSLAALVPVSRTASERDGRPLGRWFGVLFEGRQIEFGRPIRPAVAALLLLAILVLAVVATALFVGSRRPPGSGSMIRSSCPGEGRSWRSTPAGPSARPSSLRTARSSA